MRATNRRKEADDKAKTNMFHSLIKRLRMKFKSDPDNEQKAFRKAYNQMFYIGSPEFIPAKHTIQSYATQRRKAKQRRITKTGCNKS